MTSLLLTSGAVVLLTCLAFFAYEFVTFRRTTVRQLSTLGEIIATNSTAALAFDDRKAALELLAALKAEPHIVGACLYDKEGKLFAQYPSTALPADFPDICDSSGYRFEHSFLVGFQPVVLQDTKRLGTLYLKTDLKAMYERMQLYGGIVVLVISMSLLMAYFLSNKLQKRISIPILGLAQAAKVVSDQQDYSVRAIKSDNDEVGLLTDAFNHMLTQIEQQDREIKSFNQNLEEKVVERTKELEMAIKELESFSYSVSHDLRAPVRAINGYANIFIEDYGDKLEEDAIMTIKRIMSNSHKMGLLIDDLLAFSKLGRHELRKGEVSMMQIVEGIWDESKRTEKGRQVKFTLAALPTAYADIHTIKQVWINLISNALKYTRHKAEAIIDIGWEESPDSITYFVKDNGAGFDMAFYNKLFGVFQRLHSQEEFEGTGVGLAIVQRIVAKHGGNIWADSKLGEGATFYFSLPKK